jgi:CubicO group peptidase (beta-lactamase class C family)
MNRLFILGIFLIMFLSCGNSDFSLRKEAKETAPGPNAVTEMNAFHRLIASRLDSMFNGLHRTGAFNGSILVAKKGAIIFKKTLGFCNKENNCQLNDSSMFQLASVSKVITATAVLMLHERELIDLDKPFTFYFPDFPYQDITVKQMLAHRSGLPNYIYALNSEIYQPNYKMSNSDMYAYLKVKNPKIYLKPNTHFNYCNTNYALLALLVEKVSGKYFSQFLKEELFDPLGMKNTRTITEIDLSHPNVTKPYDEKWKTVDMDASDYVLGDKSLYSTAYDLYLFSEAMYHNRVIKAETQELAYAAYSKEKKLTNYGLGWRIKDHKDPARKEVYHNGWWHGYRSSFHRRLNDSLTVIVLSNQLNRAAYQTYRIYQILDNTSAADSLAEEE